MVETGFEVFLKPVHKIGEKIESNNGCIIKISLPHIFIVNGNKMGEILIFDQLSGLADKEGVNFIANGMGTALGGFDKNTTIAGTKIENSVARADFGQVEHASNHMGWGGIVNGTGSNYETIEKIN